MAISNSNPELKKIRLPTLRLRYPIRPIGWEKKDAPFGGVADCACGDLVSGFPRKTFISARISLYQPLSALAAGAVLAKSRSTFPLIGVKFATGCILVEFRIPR